MVCVRHNWEDFATIRPMDVDSDLDQDMSVGDPMDWEDSDSCAQMDIHDLMDDIISSFASLVVSD